MCLLAPQHIGHLMSLGIKTIPGATDARQDAGPTLHPIHAPHRTDRGSLSILGTMPPCPKDTAMKLLHLDSSILGENSVSRTLSKATVERLVEELHHTASKMINLSTRTVVP